MPQKLGRIGFITELGIKNMKYRILFDYTSEGHSFHDGEFETVDEAVKAALAFNSCHQFLIVSVIDWKATV